MKKSICGSRILASVFLLWSLWLLPFDFVAAADGLKITALDRYVSAPDEHYKYSVLNKVEGEGYITLIVEMTSQQWLTKAEVNLPIWEHFMVVTIPDEVVSDIGFLYIDGGSKTNQAPSAAPAADVRRALFTSTVVTTLYMVPNQPLEFVGDSAGGRSEDGIIAYTWDKFFRTGDEKWPLRLPMTKSAVRAMDTVTNLLASDAGGNLEVDQFVVAGGSKRGWTTWTTAIVDGRVVAIAPIVIDVLNVGESFKHHFSVYGSYSPAVIDYVLAGNINWNGTEQWDALMDIIEPFEYRDRLTLPKFLLNSTGDEFFLPDSWQFYWDELVGEKHMRYVPNSNHSMAGTDVTESVDAWYHGLVHNVSMPRYAWDIDEEGVITLFSQTKPTQVLLWQATNPEKRNFMQAVIGKAYVSTPVVEIEPGMYQVKVDPPETGYTAYYLEVEYPSGLSVPFKFSTGVKVVPDVTEHQWQMAPNRSRQR
ncbi:MAG: PhoPQ-activated pathogenicity-related protein [Pseudohongiellaceae bacterium]|jgi:PhoPQ-activated pathogenicity-related protein